VSQTSSALPLFRVIRYKEKKRGRTRIRYTEIFSQRFPARWKWNRRTRRCRAEELDCEIIWPFEITLASWARNVRRLFVGCSRENTFANFDRRDSDFYSSEPAASVLPAFRQAGSDECLSPLPIRRLDPMRSESREIREMNPHSERARFRSSGTRWTIAMHQSRIASSLPVAVAILNFLRSRIRGNAVISAAVMRRTIPLAVYRSLRRT